MKKFLIICLLTISSQVYAAPISGRQFDSFITKNEYRIIQTVYVRWTRSWGGTPRVETASTMLHMMMGVGKGLRLTRGELAAIKAINSQVVNRANKK